MKHLKEQRHGTSFTNKNGMFGNIRYGRNLFVVALLLLFVCPIEAQLIKSPKYRASSQKGITISSIEIADDKTIVTLSTGPNRYGINSLIFADRSNPNAQPIPVAIYLKNSYIVQSGTNKKMNMIGVDGIAPDTKLLLDPNKTKSITLIFPKIGPEVSQIDLRCGDINFFDVTIYEDKSTQRLPTPEKGIIKKDGKAWPYIKNPRFVAQSMETFKITMVELMDTATVLHFETYGGGWYRIPPESCIMPSKGGEPMFVKYAEGATINERIPYGDNGKKTYKLYFPPIDKSVDKINFKELDATGSWFVYEIEVR